MFLKVGFYLRMNTSMIKYILTPENSNVVNVYTTEENITMTTTEWNEIKSKVESPDSGFFNIDKFGFINTKIIEKYNFDSKRMNYSLQFKDNTNLFIDKTMVTGLDNKLDESLSGTEKDK